MALRALGILGEKVDAFTTRLVNACNYLKLKKCPKDIIDQLRRSGTSIGANCSEAIGAQSKADFLAKLHIARKEALETTYWIDVIYRNQCINESTYTSFKKDCDEICKLLTSITISVKKNLAAAN